MNIELYPLEKVVVDGVSIDLGMEQSDVEAAIGKGQYVKPCDRYYYYHSEMAISYNNDRKVEFIEFLGGIDGSLRPAIYGVSAFDTPANELAELLKQKNNGEIQDLERGCSLSFLNISVGVYRSATPSDVAEMIEEMKANGISTDNNKDVEADIRKANHWETIGIGTAGYYRR
ncbi:MAG: hypothetical protein IJ493_10300 [Clostridia bacterium]|nr:hypothetical protein [Clostridia bacterium]